MLKHNRIDLHGIRSLLSPGLDTLEEELAAIGGKRRAGIVVRIKGHLVRALFLSRRRDQIDIRRARLVFEQTTFHEGAERDVEDDSVQLRQATVQLDATVCAATSRTFMSQTSKEFYRHLAVLGQAHDEGTLNPAIEHLAERSLRSRRI